MNKHTQYSPVGGFTLIEMMVSVTIFTIILFISTSAFLSVVNGDRKSRAVRVATDNLNLALEDISRKIKTGSEYNCGGGAGTNDCVLGNSIFSFTDQDGVSRTMYKRGVGPGPIVNGAVSNSGCGDPLFKATQGCILRENGIASLLATSPEIDIVKLMFYVVGSAPCGAGVNCVDNPPATDAKQPMVIASIDGSIGEGVLLGGNATFKVQTTVTQRAYDH